jgi:hypothetical protein
MPVVIEQAQPLTGFTSNLTSNSPISSSHLPIQSSSPPKVALQSAIHSSSPPKTATFPEPISDISSIFGSAPHDFLSSLPTKLSPKIEPIKTSPTDYFDQIHQEQVAFSSTTSQKPKVEVLESSSLFSAFAPNFL